MKLTALEIKQQKFERVLRGFDPAEVNAYLGVVASEFEHIGAKNRELENTIRDLQEKLKHYERVESALHETLQTAKDSADKKLASARDEARNKIEKAEIEAEGIVKAAQQERQQIRQNIRSLLGRREEIIRGIKSYLEMSQESLDSFVRDDAGIYIHPADEKHESSRSKKESKANNHHPDKTEKVVEENGVSPGFGDMDNILDEID